MTGMIPEPKNNLDNTYYISAFETEKLFMRAGMVEGKDYTLLDCFKVSAMYVIAEALDNLDITLQDVNENLSDLPKVR